LLCGEKKRGFAHSALAKGDSKGKKGARLFRRKREKRELSLISGSLSRPGKVTRPLVQKGRFREPFLPRETSALA